jgi:uncharacterized membrane protein
MNALSNIFLKGLVAIVPISLTIYIIYWLGTSAESLLGGVIQRFLPHEYYWPGLGVLAGLLLVFIAGLLVNAWMIRNLFQASENLVMRLPLIKSIHGAMRDLMEFISSSHKEEENRQVVTASFGEMQMIGFVTHKEAHKLLRQEDKVLIAVYFPLSYQIGGYTVFLPPSQVKPLEMRAEDAMRLVLTAGLSTTKNKSS